MDRAPRAATGWAFARLVVALVIAVAVIAQGFSTIGGAVDAGRHVATTAANYFSFFTILSNIATALILGWSAVSRLPRGRRDAVEPHALAVAFVCVTTYMLITAAVYNLLLRAVSIGPDSVLWANEVMHVWAPLFLLADLLLGTGHRRLRWRDAFPALAFPLAWIAYTLLRAPSITAPTSGAPYWYPYPFLDPYNPAGWAGVVAHIVGIALGIIVVAFGVVVLLRWRTPHREGTAGRGSSRTRREN